MDTIALPSEMRARAEAERMAGRTVAVVPTMGYLHDGHLELVRVARERADTVVATIFVNRIQFNDASDFDGYPRTLERDAALLEREGTDILFAPEHEAMYPEGFCTRVEVDGVTDLLCGAHRPGHFRGVTTVVAKLFHVTRPHVAVFGEKDFQQLVAIRTMVRDLDMGIDVVGVPTVREPDGLAMSSRNVHLSAADRERALALHRGLDHARKRVEGGEREASTLIQEVRDRIRREAEIELEYLNIVDPNRIADVERVDGPAVMALAAHVGGTRLIDNVRLAGSDPVGADT